MITTKASVQKPSTKQGGSPVKPIVIGVVSFVAAFAVVAGLWYIFSYDPNAGLADISPTSRQFVITPQPSTFSVNDTRGPHFSVSITSKSEYKLVDTTNTTSQASYPRRTPRNGRFLVVTMTIANRGAAGVPLQLRDEGAASVHDGIVGANGMHYQAVGAYGEPGPSSATDGTITIPDDYIDCTKSCTFALVYDVPNAAQNYRAELRYYTDHIGEEIQHKGYALDMFVGAGSQ